MCFGERNFAPAAGALPWFIGREHKGEWSVDVDADEVERGANDFQIVASEFWSVRALLLQVAISVLAFEHHRQEWSVAFACVELCRLDVFGGLDQRNGKLDHLSRSDFGPDFAFCPNGLYRHPVTENGVVPNLIEFGSRQPQAGGKRDVHRAARNRYLHALMTHVHERAELVDRKEVVDTVTELVGHVAGVVRECLRRVTVLPPVLVLQSLR